jgi:voltage-gated potassium channel
MRRRTRLYRSRRSWPSREDFFLAHMAWSRHQVGRVVAAVLVSWIVGTTAIYFAERRVNPEFATWGDSFWNVWVLLFSGIDTPPKTTAGRVVTMALLVLGVGLAGLFTASVASFLIERYMRRPNVANFEMEEHLILCNWAPRGL